MGPRFAKTAPILPHSPMDSAPEGGLKKLLRGARRAENLPYTLLAVLAFLSLTARVILVLR